MSDDKNEKRMLNEILPDPERAATELASGGPRKRTAEHLKRILTMSLVGAAGAIAPKGEATPVPRQQRQERPPFIVVDSLPPPPPPPPQPPKPGYLSITSTPVADITIDGKATGLKTPQVLELKPGTHTIKLTAGDLEDTFMIQIDAEKTRSEERKLQPKAPPAEPPAQQPTQPQEAK
jgi:hypothetical protein